MFSEYSRHSNYINVPKRLVKRFRKQKDGWDLLVFAICMKLRSTSSGMYVLSPYTIMKAFHCSHRKAVRLFYQATQSELFHYNPTTHFLVARTFQRGADWVENKKGKRYYYDSVIVIEKSPDGIISHNEISRQLRDRYILRMLSAKSSSDELQRHHLPRAEAKKPITHKYLANVAGVSRSTVTRHLNKLSKGDNKELIVTTHEKIPVYDLKHGVVINDIPGRKSFVSGQYAYVRDANEYSFANKYHYAYYKHIIYNHPKRGTDNKIRQHYD